MKKVTKKHLTNNQQDYIDWQYKKIWAINNILPNLLLNYEYDTTQQYPILDPINSYDYMVNLFNKDGQHIKSLMIKLRIRTSYDNKEGLFIQKSTYIKMQKTILRSNTEMIYINCLPTSTIYFNLNQMNVEWFKREMNERTLDMDPKKIKKDIANLKMEEGINIPFIYTEMEYNKSLAPKILKKEIKGLFND